MSWEDVFIDRIPGDSKVVKAISQLFQVSEEKIVIQHEKNDISQAPLDTLVVCAMTKLAGDFPLLLEITPMQEQLIPTDDYDTLGELCELLDTQGLAIYKGEDHTLFDATLIRSKNDYQKVKLNPDFMDHPTDPKMEIVKYLEKLK